MSAGERETRQLPSRTIAEAIRSQNSSPSQPDCTYAIGSLEWQRQQEQARGEQ